MKIGLIDVDGHNYPNLALMKLSAYHKSLGDTVQWYDIFNHYDIVYMAKVFTHTPDFTQTINNAQQVVKGGTGYDINSELPPQAELITPDYSIYPNLIDKKTAYGFLTRGCIRKCPWCIVPKKEGGIRPYQDIEQIATDGRNNIVLMDNNILAAQDYATQQLEKIIKLNLKIDFNQAMDARLVTDDIARLLAQTKWSKYIRFGCDTPQQVQECHNAITKIQAHGYKGSFLLYTIIRGDINECYNRINHWKHPQYKTKVKPFAQPELNFSSQHQNIPQWQKDLAHWTNKKTCYFATDFKDFSPRTNFKCASYF